ncbi:hypothetical protein BH24DEI2_BH24DEI2_22520 [soil metagenome]
MIERIGRSPTFWGAPTQRAVMLGLAAVASLLFVVVEVAAVLVGGAPTLVTQFVYLPILLAAAFFGLRGGFVVGLLAALLPLMSGPSGEFAVGWFGGCLYLLFGITVGALFEVAQLRVRKVEKRADRLSEMYTKMLSSLARTLEVRDRHTQGHCERVAKNALVLGRALGLSETRLEQLYWSALLHDLGKIAVPEYILLKDGALTDAEYAEVKRHAEYGADLLDSVALEFAPIAEVVRSHHERFDGTGYPQRLSGEAIPLLSRVISIVDVFEALTSRRPYRQPLPPEKALSYVRAGAAEQFDPKLVALFEKCYQRGEIRSSPEANPKLTSERDFGSARTRSATA